MVYTTKDIEVKKIVEDYDVVSCDNCLKKLELVDPNYSNIKSLVYEDALIVQFDGGYGMFIDDVPKEKRTFIFCSECSLLLVEQFPCFETMAEYSGFYSKEKETVEPKKEIYEKSYCEKRVEEHKAKRYESYLKLKEEFGTNY